MKPLLFVSFVVFITNGYSQKVGIGISNPSFKLDVANGSINTDSLYRINGNPVLSIKGSQNLFLGVGAGGPNSGGSGNCVVGYNAFGSNINGVNSTAVGGSALYQNSSGDYNTALGRVALYNNTTGNYNTAVGDGALYNTQSSDGNVAVGYRAGGYFFRTWGYNNTLIGANTDANADGYYNCIAIGNTATVTASNQTRIGNSFTTSTGGYTGWTNISDGRYKMDVQANVPGLAFVLALQPVTYRLNVSLISQKLNEGHGQEPREEIREAILQKERAILSGFVAQDVEKAAKTIGYDFSGVDKPADEKGLYGLRYAEFVVPLVKAVQEQQVIIYTQTKKIESLEARLAKLEELLKSK